jgi:hypothetical protein
MIKIVINDRFKAPVYIIYLEKIITELIFYLLILALLVTCVVVNLYVSSYVNETIFRNF